MAFLKRKCPSCGNRSLPIFGGKVDGYVHLKCKHCHAEYKEILRLGCLIPLTSLVAAFFIWIWISEWLASIGFDWIKDDVVFWNIGFVSLIIFFILLIKYFSPITRFDTAVSREYKNDSSTVATNPKSESKWSWAISLLKVAFFLGLPIGMIYIAVTAYDDYSRREHTSASLAYITPIKAYYERNGSYPDSLEQLGLIDKKKFSNNIGDEASFNYIREIQIVEDAILIGFSPDFEPAYVNLIIKPIRSSNNVLWDCTGGSMSPKYRPSECRK